MRGPWGGGQGWSAASVPCAMDLAPESLIGKGGGPPVAPLLGPE